jgi:hypothetical protein
MNTKPRSVIGFGELVDLGQRRGAALGHRSQRFLEDGGQAALLVAGRGIVVHLAAIARGVILPPVNALDDLGADLRRHRAAGQQVFGTVDFRGFRQDGGAAMGDQQIGCGAQRRVGGDAGIAVGAAALHADHQMFEPCGRARDLVGLGAISLSSATPRSMVLRVPPDCWMVM